MENEISKPKRKKKPGIPIIVSILAIVVIVTSLFLIFKKDVKYFQLEELKFISPVTEETVIIKYQYDNNGRIVKEIKDSEDYRIYTYSSDYKTVTIENKDSKTKRTVKFNDDFDIVEKIYSNNSNEKFNYDKKGRLISYKNVNDITATYTYDGKKLEEERYSNGDVVKYKYSGKKVLSKVWYQNNVPINSTLYTYDSNDNIEIEDRTYDVIHYKYDKHNRVTEKSNSQGVSIKYTYDDFDNITSVIKSTPEEAYYSYKEIDIAPLVYKQNRLLITYTDVINDESIPLLPEK